MGKCKHGGPLLHHHFNLHWKTDFFYLTYGRRVLRWYQWWKLNENHWKRKILLNVYLSPYFTSNPAEGKGKVHLKRKKIFSFSYEGIYDTERQGRIPKAKLTTTATREDMKLFLSVQTLCKAERDPGGEILDFWYPLNYHLKASK